jgi:hypothetical protein
MSRLFKIASFAVVLMSLHPPLLQARAESAQAASSAVPRVKACSLVPKEDVKKHLAWNAALDRMEPEEEAIGADGSSCNYPSVFIQILPRLKKVTGPPSPTGWEAISGVGEDAYFRNNKNQYVELYVRTGTHVVTVQANADAKIEAVKPGAVNLAKALVAKLR